MTKNDVADQVQDMAAKARDFNDLPPAAQRALKEAEERRKIDEQTAPPREIGGRGGKDPARFGDWEIKGRSIDF
ncbi:DUF1674 domain-containing protein [Paenochrobactrum sp. BZR 588]|uniref:DUF1674 domain-containing protein n=1 Tax=unclassified Paenochrobactrum TaxID=2639760 RepID=UPI003854E2EB